MPYKSNIDLPDNVKGVLPAAAQSVWRNVFNSVVSNDGSEDSARKQAWGALGNQGWEKDQNGKWHKTSKFIQKNSKQHYTLGIVYEPDSIDTDDEYADGATIEKAAWDFMRKLQGDRKLTKTALKLLDAIQKVDAGEDEIEIDFEEVQKAQGMLGVMHEDWNDDLGTIIENYIMPVDAVINGEAVKKGSWMLGVVWSPQEFKKIEAGEITGYSMGGRALKERIKEAA